MVADANPAAFFVAGGTVPPGAPSYVARAADREILDALLAGEFCFVLNSRQMGKSSLAVRTIARLNDAGVRTAFVDLTRLGATGADPDRWYAGLLAETGRALGLRAEAMAYLKANAALPPVARLFGFLRDVALGLPPSGEGQGWGNAPGGEGAGGEDKGATIVLLIDEIDAVRSLPFSSDDLFAGLREMHNARATDPALARLTVCLLGAALPGDLIADPRRTPFNVGRRIELRDLAPEEAAPFAAVVGGAALGRVLHWTGGHPFLTQALCAALSEPPSPSGSSWRGGQGGEVDALVRSRYLDARARDADTNLADVGNRLLGTGDPDVGDESRAAVLALYEGMLRGKAVPDDEANPAAARIKMSGVARVEDGLLKVRNRLYREAFDLRWTRENLPGGELRRQRRAYYRGVLRTGGIATAVIAVVGGLAWNNARLARAAQVAQGRAEYAAYAAKMSLIASAWGHGDRDAVDRLLAETRGHRPRGWEWTYWNGVAHRGLIAKIPGGNTFYPRLSPDGNHVAAADAGTLRIYRVAPFRLENEIPAMTRGQETLEWMPEGDGLIESVQDRASIVDLRTRRRTTCPLPVSHPNGARRITMDGGWALVRRRGGRFSTPLLWNLRRPDRPPTPLAGVGDVANVALAPDDSRFAAIERPTDASGDTELVVRAFPDTKRVLWRRTVGNDQYVYWSPKGGLILSVDLQGGLDLWDAENGRLLDRARSTVGPGFDEAFYQNDTRLLASSADGRATVYDLSRRHFQSIKTVVGTGWVDFSPDGARLLDGLVDQRVYVSSAFLDQEREVATGGSLPVAFDEDGTAWIAHGDHTVRVDPVSGRATVASRVPGRFVDYSTSTSGPWGVVRGTGGKAFLVDLRSGRTLLRLPFRAGETTTHCPVGSDRAALARAGGVELWDLRTGKLIRRLPAGAHIYSLAYHPATDRIAVGREDGTIELLDGHGGSLGLVRPGGSSVDGMRFSADGSRIFMAGGDNNAEAWSVRDRRRTLLFHGHWNTVIDVALSPDGTRMASVGQDGTLRLWDARTGEQMTVVEGLSPMTGAVSFCQGGRAIVVAALTGEVRIFGGATDPSSILESCREGVPPLSRPLHVETDDASSSCSATEPCTCSPPRRSRLDDRFTYLLGVFGALGKLQEAFSNVRNGLTNSPPAASYKMASRTRHLRKPT